MAAGSFRFTTSSQLRRARALFSSAGTALLSFRPLSPAGLAHAATRMTANNEDVKGRQEGPRPRSVGRGYGAFPRQRFRRHPPGRTGEWKMALTPQPHTRRGADAPFSLPAAVG